MALATWGFGAAAAIAGVAVFCNLPAHWLLPAEKVTYQFLANAHLKRQDEPGEEFKASQLWANNGAVIMAVRRPG